MCPSDKEIRDEIAALTALIEHAKHSGSNTYLLWGVKAGLLWALGEGIENNKAPSEIFKLVDSLVPRDEKPN